MRVNTDFCARNSSRVIPCGVVTPMWAIHFAFFSSDQSARFARLSARTSISSMVMRPSLSLSMRSKIFTRGASNSTFSITSSPVASSFLNITSVRSFFAASSAKAAGVAAKAAAAAATTSVERRIMSFGSHHDTGARRAAGRYPD